MKAVLTFIIFFSIEGYSSSGFFTCTIKSTYENKKGFFVPRDKKHIGKNIKVNKKTKEVTGYYGTDGDEILTVKRPSEEEVLTIEQASGLLGDSANRLSINKDEDGDLVFIYNKNWIFITGTCKD